MTNKPKKHIFESSLSICKLVASILIVTISGNASATPVTIELSGTVSRVDASSPGPGGLFTVPITVGDAITGYYTYDTATPDSSADPNIGRYEMGGNNGFDLTINGLTFRTDPSSANFGIEIINDYVVNPPPGPTPPGFLPYTYDQMSISSRTNIIPFLENPRDSWIGWSLRDATQAAALSTSDLPLTAPVLSDWPSVGGLILDGSSFDGKRFTVSAAITSTRLVTVGTSVPDLGSTCSLLGFALLGLAAWRRKLG